MADGKREIVEHSVNCLPATSRRADSTPPSHPSVSSEDLALYPYESATKERTLIDILNASIAAYPDALAIDNGSVTLTYTELAGRIAGLVDQLRQSGIGACDRVGIRVTSGTTELYIGILAILSAGATYVPVDVDDPDERAGLIWREAGACAVLTDNNTITLHETKLKGVMSPRKSTPDHDAWIIFTSGSTGKPKGVAVTHRSAAAFVDAESRLFVPKKPLAPGDRVLAGLSVAFDASCEEMWLAWRHGACLVPVPRSLIKAGAELGTFITSQHISVISTVPTLAALWPTEALKRLRLLILGGEACSSELANRLASAVETVWNTYGPTEATVVSCGAPLLAEPNATVRIGLPLAGWRLAVVGADGHPVCWGEEGELIIGGIGMARYLDLEKDRVKFKPSLAFGGERAYYSGDLVRAEKEGLIFIGRNDEQVKLGGRRIELGEIDAAIMTLTGVKAAASAIQCSDTGNQVLVGYIVRDGKVLSKFDREQLKHLLPPTLIPMLVTVDSIPVRTSGKVDRKALPWPPPRSSTEDLAEGTTMAWVSDQWRAVIGASGTSPESNFFELGGTSLAAAQIVSQLRQHCHMLSVVDVYENPTLGAMTKRIDELLGTTITEREIKTDPRWAVLFQSVVIIGAFLLQGLREMAILPVFQKIFENELGPDSWASHHALPWSAVVVYFLVFFTTLGRLLTTVMIVWPLTLGIQPGTYRRAGWTHLRLWAAERFVDLGQIQSIAGTHWARHYAWALGCHIGRDVQLHALPPVTGLGSFGDGASIETEVDLAGWWIDGDLVHIGTITVGKHARVGARCVLMPDAVVKAHSVVEPGIAVQGISRHSVSSLPSRHESIHDDDFQPTSGGAGIGILYTLALFFMDVLPLLVFAPIWGLTPILVKDYNNFKEMCIGLIVMTAPGAILGGCLRAAAMIIVVRLANRSIRPGTFSWNSTNHFCAWLVHSLMAEARDSMYPIFSSLFTPTWLRLLGAKMGYNIEASTVVTLPSLLTVHDDAFLADHALAAPYELSHGKMRLGTVTVGAKSFLGNFAIASPDTRVPDESLVGVLGSTPQGLEENEQQTGSSWLGRPPMLLPRKIEGDIDETRTFTPTTKLVVMRTLIESCRMVPVILSTLIPLIADLTVYWTMWRFGFGFAILAAGALMIGVAIVTALIYIAVKCVVTPNIKAGATHPLWSSFVWRKELVDCFFYSMTLPLMLRYFLGTPVVPAFFRGLGADIGTGTWMEAAALPEANLCHLGNGATLNRGSVVQSHLFHDRLMRLDKIHLECGATIGPHSIALPGTVLGAGTTVYPMSVVMRGEHLPGSTRWAGNPICPWSGEEKEGSRSSSWDSPDGV